MSSDQTDDYDEAAWNEATASAGEVDYSKAIDEIKNTIDLASLISQDCKLDSDGRGAHENKHKSVSGNCLSVYTDSHGETKWKCHNCGENGDAMDWIASRDGLDPHDDFSEVLQIAATEAGITLPTTRQGAIERRIFECITEAARHFNNNLTNEMYARIEAKWGITRETCDHCLIGMSKMDDSLMTALRAAGFTHEEIMGTGLFSGGDVRTFSYFKGRLIFPYWQRGIAKYMIGRTTKYTPDNKYETGKKFKKFRKHKKGAEYINECVENIIYGTDSLSRKERDFVIITEGIADAIVAHQAGFPCVSPVTTKFRAVDHEPILKLVRRFDKVYICMDSEKNEAGKKGAYAIAKHLIDNEVNALIVDLPRPEGVDKVDLADYLRDHGVADFEQLLSLARPPPEYFMPNVDQFLIMNSAGKTKFSPLLFAKWLVSDSEYHFKAFTDTEELIFYRDGVYVTKGKQMIGELAELIAPEYMNNNLVSEIIGHTRRASYIERNVFDADNHTINLANGLFDFETMSIKPHTHEYLSLRKSPIIYDPGAGCARIDQFFKEVLTKKDIPFMYELFGYVLFRENAFDTAVLFEGTGANGKTKMIELLEAFAGKGMVAHVTPSELSGEDKFASADLFGKLVNTIDDLGDTPLKNLGVFKSVISGAEIRAQHKGERAFPFIPMVTCIFGCNDVPLTTDTSDGFFRRMVTVPFLKKFVGGDDNINLINELTPPDQLSGLFNVAIRAVKGAFDAGRFTGVGTIEDKKHAYVYASNPIARFVDEECNITKPDTSISKDELYQQYVLWSRNEKIEVRDMKYLTIHLKQLGCRPWKATDDDGERYPAYKSIEMKKKA